MPENPVDTAPADLVVDEHFTLEPDPADASAPRRATAWRDHKAFEVHAALRQLRAARHAGNVQLATLLRLMSKGGGCRAWGHRGFSDYVMEELRQRSPRRFQDLVRIENAIVEGPLARLGDAWRRGEILMSQARELVRVATPGNEEEWLEAARSLSVRRLHREVQRALRDPDAAMRPRGGRTRSGDASSPGAAEGAQPDEPARDAPPEGAQADAPPDTRMDEGEEEPVLRAAFAATAPVDAAWQVFLETSRRLAGFDAPVHDCVDDLLAEYASGCTLLPDDVPGGIGEVDEAGPGASDEAGRAMWHEARRAVDEAGVDLGLLRRAGRGARLAADALEGLPDGAAPDPQELHGRIRWVLRVQQRVAWHEMRLARLMAAGRLYPRLGFDSFSRYAEEALDMSARGAWGLVSLARAVESFPKVGEAFRRGEITALEAAEICRVARGGTQDDWLARARTSTLQQLREDTAFVLATGDPTGLPPSRPLPAGMGPCVEPPAVRPGDRAAGGRGRRGKVQTCETRTSGTIATTAAHRAEVWYSAFAAEPLAVAEALLSPRGRVRPVCFTAPRSIATQWALTVSDCRRRLGALAREAETAACVTDSQCVAILLLNFLGQWAGPALVKASRAFRIFTRDGWRCQVPRCRSRARLNAHHIVFRSHNGPDAAWNLVAVCRAHHEALHAGRIAAKGRAPGRLIWAMGVNAAGDVRERFCREVRIERDERWRAGTRARTVRAGDDWRAACEGTM